MSNNLSIDSKVIVSENVLFQQVNGECVLLNMDSEKYFGLDEVGARIWELFSEKNNTQQVLSRLLAEYEVDENTLKTDLLMLLTRLESEKLITIEQ